MTSTLKIVRKQMISRVEHLDSICSHLVKAPMILRIMRRRILASPDNPVCFYFYHFCIYPPILSVAHCKELLSALASDWISTQSEFLDVPMWTITFVSSVVISTLRRFVRGQRRRSPSQSS